MGERKPSQLSFRGQSYQVIQLSDLLPHDQLVTLPYSIRILLENVARRSPQALAGFLDFVSGKTQEGEVSYYPNRLMFHDTTCLPALADFAAMRDMVSEMGGDPAKINPAIPAVLAIDHSVIVEHFGEPDAFEKNLDIDFKRNEERYRFIKWAQKSLDNFDVVPPGTGIIHQVNMESLAKVVWTSVDDEGQHWMHPDNMVATDSHTPMINAIGVLGWGVGGLEGQAAMLGEPVTLTLPDVVGIRLTGKLNAGVTAMDLALVLAKKLRAMGVVGKFVEFTGPGLSSLGWAARGTVANMAPEYGATVMYFPFDDQAYEFMQLSGRTEEECERIDLYMKHQGLWRTDSDPEPEFDTLIEIALDEIEPSVAGPHLPHEHHPLSRATKSYRELAEPVNRIASSKANAVETHLDTLPEWARTLDHGAVVIAAITSCTNTANPFEMMQAGLLARNAAHLGLQRKPWVKTSLSPGSRVVADYLKHSGLLTEFEALDFHVAGFGCMTCIGNSGRLLPEVEQRVQNGLDGVAVLSGNRNFQGRVNPIVSSGYLMSPALVVAYALAGSVQINLARQPVAHTEDGQPVYLKDVMPSDDEVNALIDQFVKPELFHARNQQLWEGTHHWQALSAEQSTRFPWDMDSTYLRRPRYLENVSAHARTGIGVQGARVLMWLGSDVTTDHISPAGAIPANSLAGEYLLERGESPEHLNQYSTRRSNHEVMLRGAYTNKRVANRLPGIQHQEGVWTYPLNGGAEQPLYTAAQSYLAAGVPTLVFAGINYGAGSSRDWAAKAQMLMGVRAVVAESFERIHRSNLIGMGVLPLQLPKGISADQFQLTGQEVIDLEVPSQLVVGVNPVTVTIARPTGEHDAYTVNLRLDGQQEITYLMQGGILPAMVRKALRSA